MLGPPQWEWIAAARMVARQRPSAAAVEQVLDGLLSGADQAMVNAFTGGFRVTQTQQAINKSLPDALAAGAALESAQIVALAILVREQMAPAEFEAVYRPFATVLPGPAYQPAPPVDRQIAAFLRRLPNLKGEVEAEVKTVANALSEKAKPAAAPPAGAVSSVAAAGGSFDPAANYNAAWKLAVQTANQAGRTQAFRVMQDSGEQAAPHDGLGIVGFAGVAAGAIFMRDALPIEKVLLLYEPFAAAIPYESLL
ncbi:MAG TPA: hypothetical protein VJT78_15780 [Candidatus Dormibacteraeota bacterium]|nr:hypothetical protein [Candidatus Dormibacteraeota bacterium]